ncbi:hypothetical protein L3V82_12670 [Thiotrichales bacterium 19S3-7]|nr:hypothetical protein [Thiotrichales bacterium 19S3-7]MCF6803027.1 hypothetical protein [Thiotrichales bacterium 19S3-11]
MAVVTYQITANDTDITALLNDYLISLTITDSIGDHSDSLTIVLHDTQEQISFPPAGAELKISLGAKDSLSSFGTFVVDQVSYKTPPSMIEISAKSVPFNKSNQYQAMQTQKNRSFDQTTVGTIVNQIANEHALAAVIAPEIESKLVDHIDQTNESNVGFLHRLARLHNAKLKLTYEKILLLKAQGRTVNGNDITPIDLNLTDLTSLSYTTQKKISYQSVIAQYHDIDSGETKEIIIGFGEPVMRATYLYPDESQARQMAEKVLSKAQDDSDEINFSMAGNPQIISGVPIKISGLRADISQDWVVKTAIHSLSESGYVVSIGG